MSRPHTLKTITASTTLLFALSLSLTLTNLAGAAPQKVLPIAKVAIHHQRVSPPNAGVKLLEDILSRMRNLPQIAMSYNKQTYQYQQKAQNAAPGQGATDQLLAIRPKESSLKAKASEERRKSTIAWDNKAGEGYYAPRRMQKERSYSKDDRAQGDEFRSGQPDSSMGKRALQQARPEYTREYGSVKTPSSTTAAVRGSLMSNTAASQSNMLASNARSMSNLDAATKDITDRLSPEARQRLTASTGKLFDVAKKLEEAQQYAQGLNRQSAGGGGGGGAGIGGNYHGPVVADERHSQSGPFRNEGKQAKVISTNPLITEYDKGANFSGGQIANDEEAETKPAEKAVDKPQAIARGLVPPPAAAPMSMPFPSPEATPQMFAQKPPAEPSLFKHVREFLNRDGIANSVSGSPRQDASSLEKNKPIEIALLPPSVVTGIPLVRLGTSENETNKVLAGKGSLNKTQVNDWSVWSLQKPGNDDVSLQIYTRNGQVEAMRIFDSSLISPDFGVKLGDDLGTVKHKFGEPAFKLSEPQSRGGQNYVYPISQVSFQLAYSSKTTAPKVVSLLIFNAK